MQRGPPSIAGTAVLLAALVAVPAAVSYPRVAAGVGVGVTATVLLRRLSARLAERRQPGRTERSERRDGTDPSDGPATALLATGRGRGD